VHPPISHKNIPRTTAEADVAEDLNLWTAGAAKGPTVTCAINLGVEKTGLGAFLD
jgi:hypothetical protein